MLKRRLKELASLPPRRALERILNKATRRVRDKVQKWKDFTWPTWITVSVSKIENSYIDISQLDVSGIDKKIARYLCEMYLSHRFDLLGSGWVKISYGSKPLGVEGFKYNGKVKFDLNTLLRRAHQKRAKNIYLLIDKDYEPIDWQKDYKSGFRWSEKEWYKDARKSIGKFPGVDIKVPWELARMQHLPQLAFFSLVLPEYTKRNLKEFKNQTLDFIATNPPRMGVNWACAMDVAIRAVNLLIAYDMFCQLDKYGILSTEFQEIFAEGIYEHGYFIVNNLEWNEGLTNNHYLSNVAGLLFVGAYLGITDWISFAYHEIIKETEKQFYDDGGNFESSTSYHRLSGEMVVYSTALILKLLKDGKIKKIDYEITQNRLKVKRLYDETIKALPQQFIDRVYKLGRFTVDITKPNGEVPQIGDNDSGRFVRFSPNGRFITNRKAEEIYLNLKGYNEIIKDYDTEKGLFWEENTLNHQTFISAVGGLFEDEIFKSEFPLEKSLIESVTQGKKLKPADKSYKPVRIVKVQNMNIEDLKYEKEKEYKLPFSLEEHPVKTYFYPDFGILIFKNERLYLSVCVTPLGQSGNGGHTHNDKLSYELWVNGKDLEIDPGTYVYTPLPQKRNAFRSVKAHNVPIFDNIEQNRWPSNKKEISSLFKLQKESDLQVVKADNKELEILLIIHQRYVCLRRFIFQNNLLTIIDKANADFSYSNFEFYSNGYGRISLWKRSC